MKYSHARDAYSCIKQIKRNIRKQECRKNKHAKKGSDKKHHIHTCEMYYICCDQTIFIYCKTCDVFLCVANVHGTILSSRLKPPRNKTRGGGGEDVANTKWDVILTAYSMEPMQKRLETLKKKCINKLNVCNNVLSALYPLHDTHIYNMREMCINVLQYSYLEYINIYVKHEMAKKDILGARLLPQNEDVLRILQFNDISDYI